MSDLPNGWVSACLTEITELHDSKRIPLNQQQRSSCQGIYPYYGANGQVDSIDNFLFDGDYILLAEDGGYFDDPSRNVAYEVSGRFWVNNHAHILATFREMPRRFLTYALNSIDWMAYVGGSTRLKLTQEGMKRVLLPFPPLSEQQRIVAKLDSLFAHSRRTREELEHIPKLIKRYKQAVLAAAFRGDLTEDWRIKQKLEESWESTTLAEVIVDKPKNGYSAKPVQYETPFRVLTLTATTSGKFNPEHYKYFEETADIGENFWLQPNDILIQRGNTIEYVGVAAIYDGLPNQFIFPDLMIRVRAKPIVLNQFLHMVLSCEKSRQYLRDRATGTAGSMPKINQPTLISLPIELPTIEEQKEIIRRVEKMFKSIESIEEQYQQARQLCDRLEQATLAKAFRGELVPQDPNDEPASVLLERICAEKQQPVVSTGKKSRRKTA